MRHGRLLLLAFAGWWSAAWADVSPYLPFKAGARLTYRTTTSLDADARLQWETSLRRAEELDGGAERVVLRSAARFWVSGRPLEREETLVREPRGLFSGEANGAYGPTPLLPAAPELERADAIWVYEGRRSLPFPLAVLNLLRHNDGPVRTTGRYHVLNLAPLETAAGRFGQAVQVTGVERVTMALRGEQPEDVMLRCRRWYVRGLGLAREVVEFAEYPSLGRLTTELVAYVGLTPAEAGVTQAGER